VLLLYVLMVTLFQNTLLCDGKCYQITGKVEFGLQRFFKKYNEDKVLDKIDKPDTFVFNAINDDGTIYMLRFYADKDCRNAEEGGSLDVEKGVSDISLLYFLPKNKHGFVMLNNDNGVSTIKTTYELAEWFKNYK